METESIRSIELNFKNRVLDNSSFMRDSGIVPPGVKSAVLAIGAFFFIEAMPFRADSFVP